MSRPLARWHRAHRPQRHPSAGLATPPHPKALDFARAGETTVIAGTAANPAQT